MFRRFCERDVQAKGREQRTQPDPSTSGSSVTVRVRMHFDFSSFSVSKTGPGECMTHIHYSWDVVVFSKYTHPHTVPVKSLDTATHSRGFSLSVQLSTLFE